jgi:hypothetical protein
MAATIRNLQGKVLPMLVAGANFAAGFRAMLLVAEAHRKLAKMAARRRDPRPLEPAVRPRAVAGSNKCSSTIRRANRARRQKPGSRWKAERLTTRAPWDKLLRLTPFS